MAEKGEKRDPVTHRTPTQMRRMSHGYNSTPGHIEERSQRNKARAMLEKEGRVHKGDNKDVDHKQPIRRGGSNARSNLRVQGEGKNRGWNRSL